MDYRYHCVDPRRAGRNTLPFNPCRLLDFTLLRLEAGADLDRRVGRPGDPRRHPRRHARPSPSATGLRAVGGRADVFSGRPHSVYIPAGATVTDRGGHAGGDRAAQRAQRPRRRARTSSGPTQVATGRWGAANFSRNYHQILTEVSQPRPAGAPTHRRRDLHAVGQLEHLPAAPPQGRRPARRGAARGDVLLPRQPGRRLRHQPRLHRRGVRGERRRPRPRDADDARGLPHRRQRARLHHLLPVVPRRHAAHPGCAGGRRPEVGRAAASRRCASWGSSRWSSTSSGSTAGSRWSPAPTGASGRRSRSRSPRPAPTSPCSAAPTPAATDRAVSRPSVAAVVWCRP